MQIRLRNVSHDYGSSDESAAVHVLDGVSLDIRSGDFAVLMGASGSGKSTLLNLIGAVDKPTSGDVVLGDVETSALSEQKLTDLRRTSIGFIFQFFNLIPTLDVFENVAFPLSLARRPKREIAPLTTPTSSPAARCSAWPSAGPSSTGRRSSSPTSPPATSTPSTARRFSI
jgi:putative ABC transport system ATP-binding protein